MHKHPFPKFPARNRIIIKKSAGASVYGNLFTMTAASSSLQEPLIESRRIKACFPLDLSIG